MADRRDISHEADKAQIQQTQKLTDLINQQQVADRKANKIIGMTLAILILTAIMVGIAVYQLFPERSPMPISQPSPISPDTSPSPPSTSPETPPS